MKLLSVVKSTNAKKKYMATFCTCEGSTKCEPKNRKVVHFGATGYTDYTLTGDKEKRRLYRLRHAKEANQAFDTPGRLSIDLLWGDSISLQENIRTFKKKLSC